ncbi:MAG TPA: hypothetical protein VJ385_04545 [Fibrobacteria bacterium]|nr:hypothetical protein [Fibrobacteria bacterium]
MTKDAGISDSRTSDIRTNARRDFLKFTGLMGAASLIPAGKAAAGSRAAGSASAACALIPGETAGPFPLDLTANAFYLRQDIRENRTGVPLKLRLKVLGMANCAPMPDVRVNVWHCDKDGNYSGYDNQMNPGQAGLTYLRGYQVADASGEVAFTTIFPGWYNGRIAHIHFQVYVSSSYAAISQLTWDVAAKNAVYAANPAVYSKGADPTSFAGDSVFNNGYQFQLASLTADAATGGYESYLEVSVNGTGTAGLGHLESLNAAQFALGQSFPNPHFGEVTIPFSLKQRADVVMDIRDLSGKQVASIPARGLAAEEHAMRVHLGSLGLATRDYLYQLEVVNASGRYTQYKRMTAGRP